MAVDIVGYSRLLEVDETSTLVALQELRRGVLEPLLLKHHGRTVKTMGDGILAEFRSVVDAAACAVALQQQVAASQAAKSPDRRLVLRIGLNLGSGLITNS
jgi:adenylate cyclase